jgi:outer membrane protein assembly factor BamB
MESWLSPRIVPKQAPMAPDNPTIPKAGAGLTARWVFPWLAGLLLAGCGENKSEPTANEPTSWKTQEWPMTRGGKELQGRVHDRVPKNPKVGWTFRVKGAVASEAAVAKGVIVFGSDEGMVYAVDLKTRQERWRMETKDTVEATPAIVSDRAFVGSNDNTFRALDLTTGKEIWHIDGEEKFPTGAVPVTGPDGEEWILVNGYDGVSRCLRTKDGSEVWKHETQDYINGSPAILDGGLMAFGGCDSVIHVVQLKDGVALNQVKSDAQIIRSLAGWGGTVYGVNYANQLFATDVKADKLTWLYENDDAQFLTSPAVDEERVYAGSRDKHLHAVDRLSGKPAWKFKTGGRVESSPLVFDDAVVFGSSDGRLYAVNKQDGGEIWKLDLGENLGNAPAFADGRIVIGGGDGTLFVIGEGAGK